MLARIARGSLTAIAIAVGTLSAGAAGAFYDEGLADRSYRYADELRGLAAGSTVTTDVLMARARQAGAEGRWADAAQALAIAAGRDTSDGAALVELARALAKSGSFENALRAAYLGLSSAGDTATRLEALRLAGALAERTESWSVAIAAVRETIDLVPDDASARAMLERLERLYGFRIEQTSIASDQETPQICASFTAELAASPDVRPSDFVRIDPPTPIEVTVAGGTLCIEGVEYGVAYTVSVLSGIPAADGRRLTRTDTFESIVADRTPLVAFQAGGDYVLAAGGEGTAPLTTVNVEEVALRLLRINDRNLVNEIIESRLGQGLWTYDSDYVADNRGELVWEGTMAVEPDPNHTVVTGVPVAELIPDAEPGIYILTAARKGAEDEYGYLATQWVVSTDLGAQTFVGDGVDVAVRSLATGRALPGIKATLIARNNTVLGEALSDADGIARLPAGLARGSRGRDPALLLVQSEDDFNLVDLTGPAFDFSDRGVGGLPYPGALDGYLWSSRGVFRPGEPVDLNAILRAGAGGPAPSMPLILKINRPDGMEIASLPVEDQGAGGYQAIFTLPSSARTGTWYVTLHAEAEGPAIGQTAFQVEDFVPLRLRLGLVPASSSMEAGVPVEVGVAADFLYGAPAADLAGEASLSLHIAGNPFPAWSGYQFGLVQESFQSIQQPLELAPTGPDGRTVATAVIDRLPDVTSPLQARIQVSLFDIGGRAVNEFVSLPVRAGRPSIGLRMPDGTGVEEGATAAVEVIAVDDDGRRIALAGLEYTVVEEEYDYEWFLSGSDWNYRVVVRERPMPSAGTFAVGTDAPAVVTAQSRQGRYRVDVFDRASGAASSIRFTAGWWVDPTVADTPDILDVTPDAAGYAAGDVARVHIDAPFAGPALVTVANDRLRWAANVDLGEDGTVVEIPIDAAWGVGAYVMATAFRTAEDGSGGRGPARAIGLAWLDVSSNHHTLGVAIDAPSQILPRSGRLEVPVEVAGLAPGEEAYVTLAAVDEGILLLTGYGSPDPQGHFFGKRALGLDMRDVWGRLIVSQGRRGLLRSGGDGDQLPGLAVTVTRTAAFQSDIVPVAADGRAVLTLDVPDFNGELRLMAVAWSANAVGSAVQPLVVRDPAVLELALPRFLAPGDRADAALSIDNVAGADGQWQVAIAVDGPLAIAKGNAFDVPLSRGQRFQRTLPVSATGIGVGRIALALTGPGGEAVAREWEIAVRPAQAVMTERIAGTLEPGQSFRVDDGPLDLFVPGTGRLTASFGSGPDLDAPGRLDALAGYAYGCLEQTASRGMALLEADDLATRTGTLLVGDAGRDVQAAVDRVLGMQLRDGSFGMWSAFDAGTPWASAYATDFLTRAKEDGYMVADAPWRTALASLRDYIARYDVRDRCEPTAAYALNVLARAGAADVADIRSYADACLRSFGTPFAAAQIGAALAIHGDMVRADRAFALATADRPQVEPTGLIDYGSALRDRAAVTALMAEAGRPQAAVLAEAERAAAILSTTDWTSTQEDAWLIMAAAMIAEDGGDVDVLVDGIAPAAASRGPVVIEPDAAALARGVEVANAGTGPLFRSLAIRGIPVDTLPPEANDLSIARTFLDRHGRPIDPIADGLTQNDLVIVVLEGSTVTRFRRDALIVDLLPAGLEIENPRIGGRGMEELEANLALTGIIHAESRDDRYVAAVELSEYAPEFKVAYLARAVSPGSFVLPAAYVEDMYRPQYFARTGQERLTVAPAR